MPPPRSGDWNSINRFLTAGGTVEGIPRENPYREYYLSLMKKRMEKPQLDAKESEAYINIVKHGNYDDMFDFGYAIGRERFAKEQLAQLTNPCGKPHNNGEDTCNECLTIKEGI